jgi:hypothetical protein
MMLLAAAFALAAAQDAKGWAEALAVYQKSSTARAALDRAHAADALGGAVYDKVEGKCFTLVAQILRAELAREGAGGKSEEKVSGDVLDACLRTLKKLGGKDPVEDLWKIARAKGENPRLRAFCLWALADKGQAKEFADLVDDKTPLVQMAALDALATRTDETLIPLFFRVLGEDRPWEVKLPALQGLGRSADLKTAEALVDGLAKVRADQGRLKDEILKILRKVLETDLESDDPNAWRVALAAKKDGGDIPQGTTRVRPTDFYGLKTRSSRIVFILDRTGSMDAPGTEPERTVARLPMEASTDVKESKEDKYAREECAKIVKKWDAVKAATRMDVARKEFINTVYALSPKVQFNVIWFESTPTPWKPELVAATWMAKLECMKEADKLRAGGGTNIWDAMELGLRFLESPGRPDVYAIDRRANYAAVIGGADTFFLMSDGKPSTGKLTVTSEILAEVRKVHRVRRMTVHTICIGEAEPGQEAAPDAPDPVLLKRISEETGGDFVHIKK